MRHGPDQLAGELRTLTEHLHDLRTNGRLAALLEDYHEIEAWLHRLETREEHASGDVLRELAHRRDRLRDEIGALLAGAVGTAQGATASS